MSKVLLNAGQSPRGWHRLENFMRCPTLGAVRAPRLVMPDATSGIWATLAKRADQDKSTSDPLARGSLAHVGLCHYYARLGADGDGGCYAENNHYTSSDQLYAPDEAVTLAAIQSESDTWLKWVDPVNSMLKSYISFWGKREKLRPLFVECVWWVRWANDPSDPEGKLPLGEGRYDLSYRVDLVASGPRGKLYWIDHKSAGRINGNGKWKASFYSRTGQFVGYRWLGTQNLGERFGGTILNLFSVPADGSEPVFVRPPLSPVPERVKRFPQNVMDAEDRLAHWTKRTREEGLSPLDWPAYPSEHTCQTRYGPCPVVDACDWGLSQT